MIPGCASNKKNQKRVGLIWIIWILNGRFSIFTIIRIGNIDLLSPVQAKRSARNSIIIHSQTIAVKTETVRLNESCMITL